MNEEQVQEMESWYSFNVINKILVIALLGLVLLPFSIVLIRKNSAGTRLCLLICVALNLLANVILWLETIS